MNNKDFDELDQFIKINYEKNKLKRKQRKTIIIILINILSIGCLVAGGFGLKYIYDYQNDLKENELLQEKMAHYYIELEKKKEEEIKKIEEEQRQEEEQKKLELQSKIDFATLLSTNPDTVGWLKVKKTNVDIPIVKANDNDYYLTHNYEGKWNSFGWVFADYRNDFPSLDKNTIFYGHTFKNSLMFSSLTTTLKDEWLNNPDNLIIEFSTTEEFMEWQIFSIYTTPKTNDYIVTNFSDESFNEFINLIKGRSMRDFGIDVYTDDTIITLSTCYLSSKNRLVIHAKLIRG